MGAKIPLTDEQINWLKVQDAKGVPRPQIVAEFVATTGTPLSIARLRQIVGTRTQPRQKRQTKDQLLRATVENTAGELAYLRDLAAELGYRNSYGVTAGEGNLSDFLAAIAAGDLTVTVRTPAGARRQFVAPLASEDAEPELIPGVPEDDTRSPGLLNGDDLRDSA